MRANNCQLGPEIDPHPDSPAWFKTRQIQWLNQQHIKIFAHQNGISMPTNTHAAARHLDQIKVRLSLDHLARQRGRAHAQPLVRFLQNHNIRVQPIDHLQSAFRPALLVKTTGLADIVTCNAYVSFFHETYMGVATPDFNVRRESKP